MSCRARYSCPFPSIVSTEESLLIFDLISASVIRFHYQVYTKFRGLFSVLSEYQNEIQHAELYSSSISKKSTQLHRYEGFCLIMLIESLAEAVDKFSGPNSTL